jgi:hypothetical protein
MLKRRAWLVAVTATLLLASTVGGQQRPAGSPISDLIARLNNFVNDFQYAEAIRVGTSATALVRLMRPEQLIAFRTVMAAAYYPDDREAQDAASALRELDALVLLQPDARITPELRWRGLDSLLEVSRGRTFSVAARPSASYALSGTEGRAFVDVVASRPTRFRLVTTARGQGGAVTHDSAAFATTARLGLRAHDGVRPLLARGAYDLVLIATDEATGDSTKLSFSLEVDAEPIETVPVPAFDPAWLRPEREPPRRVRTVLKGLLFAGFTYGVAAYARAEEPLRTAHPTDTRAYAVSGAMLGAVVVAAIADRGRDLPENVRWNAAAQVAHAEMIRSTLDENARRVREYRVTLKVAAEEQP